MKNFLLRCSVYLVGGVIIKCVFPMEVGIFSHALLTALLSEVIFKLLDGRNKE